MYINRTYRNFDKNENLIPFQVSIKETDLYLKAQKNLEKEARDLAFRYRSQIENYILSHPAFEKSLVPLPYDDYAPLIVQEMLRASSLVGVGPMAAVAGAIAEFVGKSLLKYSSEVIVENGGDIFLSTAEKEIIVKIVAGASPLSQKIGIKVLPSETPLGICTSSGTVGPSLSFGKADAVTIVSPSTALADSVATAVGNRVKKPDDIPFSLKVAESLSEIKGIIIIVGEKMGVWGNIELVKL
ncbi:MAG: UPF0280 family protein [Thermodesulfobacteriota bacterium]|jgi:ApbE superfamily uncharacterized protein (UPF0280 family)|nr:MAG: UPF0280 family protein [Thermodesulfobacteriota bacterium]